MKKSLAIIILTFCLIPSLTLAVGTKKIGEVCIDSNSECESGDCEASSQTDANGNTINYCVCSDDASCVRQYNGEEKDWDCANGQPMTWGLNFCINTVNSANSKLAIPPKSQNFWDYLINTNAVPTTVKLLDEVKTVKPSPKINIPGINFSEVKTVEENGNTYMYIPFLGEYIAGIYKYAIAAMGVIAIVMIINQGLGWVLSGGSAEKISHAKKRIGEAIIGLFLAVGSYTLLYFINPNLVEFRNLKVAYVQGLPLGAVTSGEFENQTANEQLNPEYDPSVLANGNIPFFAQCDPIWASKPYGSGTVCKEGCGLTSLAMVFSFYKNSITPAYQNLTTPGNVSEVALQQKIRPSGDSFVGTSYPVFRGITQAYGLKFDNAVKENLARGYLNQGFPVIGYVQNKNRERDKSLPIDEKRSKSSCRFTASGHYIVLTAYDQNKDIYSINDPARNIPPPERKQATSAYLRDNCNVSFIYVHP